MAHVVGGGIAGLIGIAGAYGLITDADRRRMLRQGDQDVLLDVIRSQQIADLAIAAILSASVYDLLYPKEEEAAPDLPSKMRAWLQENEAKVNEDLKRSEPREPTPYTAARMFSPRQKVNGKPHCFLKKKSKEIWHCDLLHCNHFEVYSNRRQFDKGIRNRSVTMDGRILSIF